LEEPKEGNPKGGNREGETLWIFFFAVHACNSHHEWLIIFFGIGSNLFKLLCIEVIFIYNIQFLIDD